jgi:hypothetical protein
VLDARVVHRDVEPAELFHGPLYQRLDVFGFRDVGPDGDGPASTVLDLFDCRGSSLSVR